MEDYIEFATEFKKLILNTLSQDENCIDTIAKSLGLTPRTIYNKFNGAGEFTISETIKLIKEFGINPTTLVCSGAKNSSLPLSIFYYDLTDKDIYERKMSHIICAYEKGAGGSNSKYMVTSNQIPEIGYMEEMPLMRLYLLKWLYYKKGPSQMMPFSEIKVSEKGRGLIKRYKESILSLKKSVYILTNDMFKNCLDEILFFYKIKVVTASEVRELISSVERVFNLFENACTTGLSLNPGKEVDIFCSRMNIYNEMALMESDRGNMGFFLAHFQYAVMTNTPETFQMAKEWFHSWLRSASIISLSSPEERYNFMTKQRGDIQRMKSLFNA